MSRFPSHNETRENGIPAPPVWVGSGSDRSLPSPSGKTYSTTGFATSQTHLVAAERRPCFRLSTDRFRTRQELHFRP